MVKLRDIDVEEYLLESVSIDEALIMDEFVNVSKTLAYWNHRMAQVYEAYQNAKFRYEFAQAEVYLETRATSTSKLTEAQLEALVTVDDVVAGRREALIAAEAEKVRVSGIVDAIKTKKDMLISMGAHIRAELHGDPSIRVPEYATAKLA